MVVPTLRLYVGGRDPDCRRFSRHVGALMFDIGEESPSSLRILYPGNAGPPAVLLCEAKQNSGGGLELQ